MSRDVYTLLAEAEEYLGGFMGSVLAYRRVEELREEIRIVLRARDNILIPGIYDEKSK